MKQLTMLTLLIIAGALAWLLSDRLSSDALGLAVGMVFGVSAGIPTALLVMATQRRGRPNDEDDDPRPIRPPTYAPPVIVVTGQQQPQWQPPLHQPWTQRRRIVGQTDDWDYDPILTDGQSEDW